MEYRSEIRKQFFKSKKNEQIKKYINIHIYKIYTNIIWEKEGFHKQDTKDGGEYGSYHTLTRFSLIQFFHNQTLSVHVEHILSSLK